MKFEITVTADGDGNIGDQSLACVLKLEAKSLIDGSKIVSKTCNVNLDIVGTA